MALDQDRAFYGYEYCKLAVEFGACETLLITDSKFRVDIDERKKYLHLVELVKNQGGTVLIFSSLHSSGEQLELLTGVACILHFGMPDLEQQVEELGLN